ncbi:MAG: NAD-dependent epimerase/dehydratase family protein [Simkaniaceae bacterium]|nr:MAG: NAD-dependent epimerase/dehydratase family protein [Simkaniaceae bacterium]
MRVVVTGIRSSLAKKAALLLRDKGYEVMGFARTMGEPLKGIEVRTGDIRCRQSVYELLKGADGVIHCAALSSPWGKYQDFYETNVRGTEHLLDAALDCGVKRFVHVSTPSLYYEFKDRWNITEKCSLSNCFANHYVQTKFLAEKAVDWSESRGLSCVTIRPRGVFGPGDQVLLPRLIKALDRGGIPRFTDRGVWVDITYVDNAAESLVLALENGRSGGKYNITNGEPCELFVMFSELADKIGREMKIRKIPYELAKSLAKGADWVSKLTRKEPLFTPYTIGVLAHSQIFDIHLAKKELGYLPRVSVKEGINRYAEWWCESQNV